MLKENRYLRICTHNKDGTIHAMPVAYRYLNGQILIISIAKSRKNRNIKRNNDVTVLIDTLDPLKGILIYGKAEIDYDNVLEQTASVMEGAEFRTKVIVHELLHIKYSTHGKRAL
jgi:general stress protein 26